MRPLLLLLVGICSACTGKKVLHIGDIEGVVITGDEAKVVLSPCSRSAPDPADGMWNPTIEDIRRFEEALPSYVSAHPPDSKLLGPVRELAKYKRQYVGLSRGDRKSIYASLFLYADHIGAPDWRSEAVQICDGGSGVFGVEYDLQSRSFTHIDYNGEG